MEVSREEAKRILRRLELEAYSSIVSTFRAQGDLNREKKKLLTDLGIHLSISTERHRAEVRRAYSDDRLGAVAECIVGPTTCSEWAAEGRRLVPLMPRLVPQTVLSGTATASANAAAAANAQIVQTKKLSTPSTVSQTSGATPMSTKPSPVKPLARQSSETVDVEYDSDDNKAKKKRRLSQSITTPKPVQKITLNPSIVGTKAGAKTASVSTSTMTKAGKPATPTGTVKATPKLMLPASASQVKLLTKTVSITQTVNQAKSVLNYKTVSATNPAAVKVQTVMSHTTPKTQVKMTVPVTSKNVLVPKVGASTSPSKAVATPSAIKSAITMAQLAASKQRGKQTTRFKPMPGAVKFKSVTALAMGLPSAPATMATASSNISTLTGTVTTAVPSTQPIVRVIQVPGAGITSTTNKTVPTVMMGLPKVSALSISGGSNITKIPSISTTVPTSTTQASRLTTTTSNSTLPTSAKTVVMTTIVGGTKKVVLSVPAPLSPIPSKPSVNITKTAKALVLASQLVQSTGDNTTKQDGTTKTKMAVPSLECTEPSSVLQAPTPIVPKQGTTQVSSSQVRIRPLQTLLPAPPKPVNVAPATSLPSNSGVRKLPQLLPAPAKTTVLVPLSTPATQTVCTTGVSSVSTTVHPKVPLVQFVAKSTLPAAKVSVSKTAPVTSVKVSIAPATVQQPIKQSVSVNQATPTTIKSSVTIPETKPSTASESSVPLSEHAENDKTVNSSSKSDNNAAEKESSESDENKIEGDSNTSSEDDFLLVCSETIDCGAGLQDIPSIQEEEGSSPVDVLAISTPLKSTDQSRVGKEEVVSAPKKNERSPVVEKSNSSGNSKVIVEMLDSFESPLMSKGDTNSVFSNKDENKNDGVIDLNNENNTNLHDNKIIDKVVSHENFDAVSSFLETFAGQNIDNSRKDLTEDDANILPDITKTFEEENQNISGKNQNLLTLHQLDNEIQRTLLDDTPEQNSLLSAFDILDTPMAHANETRGSQISLADVLVSIPVPSQDTHTLPKEFSGKKIADGSISVKSLKSFAESSLEQSIQNSTHSHEVRSGLSRNSSESSDTYSTKFSFSNIEVAATSSDGQELTESEKLALEAIANVRTSSRKRKPPTVLTPSPPRQTSGWVRGALSLLQKVCSYRGQGRKKGDYSASSWFLRPVDPIEAPGYFKVIKTPMDLSTIKTKLETGDYQDYMEFHDDMVLIKSNCYKYNPPGHAIRKDCEEVFNYFDAEYEKMLERWEKCHVSPAKKPRTIPKQELTSSASW